MKSKLNKRETYLEFSRAHLLSEVPLPYSLYLPSSYNIFKMILLRYFLGSESLIDSLEKTSGSYKEKIKKIKKKYPNKFDKYLNTYVLFKKIYDCANYEIIKKKGNSPIFNFKTKNKEIKFTLNDLRQHLKEGREFCALVFEKNKKNI